MFLTDAPVVTIGVVISPPGAVLALVVAVPIVVIRVFHIPRDDVPILLFVRISVRNYFARGPPGYSGVISNLSPAWPSCCAGFYLYGA